MYIKCYLFFEALSSVSMLVVVFCDFSFLFMHIWLHILHWTMRCLHTQLLLSRVIYFLEDIKHITKNTQVKISTYKHILIPY